MFYSRLGRCPGEGSSKSFDRTSVSMDCHARNLWTGRGDTKLTKDVQYKYCTDCSTILIVWPSKAIGPLDIHMHRSTLGPERKLPPLRSLRPCRHTAIARTSQISGNRLLFASESSHRAYNMPCCDNRGRRDTPVCLMIQSEILADTCKHHVLPAAPF